MLSLESAPWAFLDWSYLSGAMRLFTRLLIGHSAPVLVVTAALGLTLVALLRMTAVLETISDTELAALHKESMLHRASWSIDVALRQGESACRAARQDKQVGRRIEQAARALREALQNAPNADLPMQQVAGGWLAIATDVQNGDVCDKLRHPAFEEKRSQLDDRLTDLWAGRLTELHAAVARKDEQARSIGVTAATAGSALAVASILLAMVLARGMARALNLPLARLADITRRVGRGDFSTPVSASGPPELVALAEELEIMRRQLAELELMKQNFLASVSHELRTPLSKIREALALLSDGAVGSLEERQLRVVQIARAACEREIRLVTTLLDLSRLRTGSPLRLRNDASLDAVIEAALADERGEATSRGVRIVWQAEGESPSCRLDPVLTERAIANLIRNAVAVSSEGQEVRVLRVLATPDGETGAWARITVSDDGPGVPDDIRDTVFDAFVTSAVARSPKALGVGLGLALAREVAVAHGGHVVLDQTTQQGATFHLWLPLGRLDRQRMPHIASRRTEEQASK